MSRLDPSELYGLKALRGVSIESVEELLESCELRRLSPGDVLLDLYGDDRPDVVVGSPVANRVEPNLEKLIGFFINTLPIRIRLTREMTGKDLLLQVRQAALDAYAHQDVPFEHLVMELAPPRRTDVTPIFQVLFSVLNTPARLPVLRQNAFVSNRAGTMQLLLQGALELLDGGAHVACRQLLDADLEQKRRDRISRDRADALFVCHFWFLRRGNPSSSLCL